MSGGNDQAEFRKCLLELGFDMPYEDLNSVFADMDVDGSGSLDYNELHRQIRHGSAVKLKKKLQIGNVGQIDVTAANKKYSLRGDLAAISPHRLPQPDDRIRAPEPPGVATPW